MTPGEHPCYLGLYGLGIAGGVGCHGRQDTRGVRAPRGRGSFRSTTREVEQLKSIVIPLADAVTKLAATVGWEFGR